MANPKPVQTKEVIARRGGGRPAGVPNKTTTGIREAIQRMLDKRVAPNLERWITEIERDHGPKEAMKAVAMWVEFGVPKLGRTELVGKDGGDINVRVRWQDENDA